MLLTIEIVCYINIEYPKIFQNYNIREKQTKGE